MSASTRNEIFISYAHGDAEWKDRFEAMLAPAARRGLVQIWSDRQIQPGGEWLREIEGALSRARVGLLLVSNNFLNSAFINEVELRELLGSAAKGKTSIRWVSISASLYEYTDLSGIQACGNPARPLDQLSQVEQDAAIKRICTELIEGFAAMVNVSADYREKLRHQVQAQLGDKYELDEEVSSGKYSIFYRAHRTEPRRQVGVKALIASELDDWARQAYQEGVARAVKLESPAFIKVLDDYLAEPPHCLVSEYIEAEKLSTLLHHRHEGLLPSQVKSILLDVGAAIDEAHRLGARRGELYPSDVLIDQAGRARLSSLNFSNILRETSQLAGNFMADRESLTYMTPERYYGNELSSHTDQYSLGLLAIELLAGPSLPRVHSPSDLASKPELFARLEKGDGAWAERFPEFAAIVRRMLRIDPETRWPSLSVVLDFIRQIDLDSTMEMHKKIAKSSYLMFQSRGLEYEKAFYQTFYSNLFEALPEVAHFFDSKNMERQYRMLDSALHLLLDFDLESERWVDELSAIAEKHAHLPLREHHLTTFRDVLLETVASELEEIGPSVDAWRATLRPGVEYLWRRLEEKRKAMAPGGPGPTERFQ